MSETMKAAVPAGVTRRNILAAPLLAAMAGSYAEGARAAVPAETPVMALFREWKRIDARAKAYTYDPADGDNEDVVLDHLFYNDRDAVEDRMMAEQSQTAQDMAAKMVVAHCFGELSCLDWDGRFWAEARALVAA